MASEAEQGRFPSSPRETGMEGLHMGFPRRCWTRFRCLVVDRLDSGSRIIRHTTATLLGQKGRKRGDSGATRGVVRGLGNWLWASLWGWYPRAELNCYPRFRRPTMKSLGSALAAAFAVGRNYPGTLRAHFTLRPFAAGSRSTAQRVSPRADPEPTAVFRSRRADSDPSRSTCRVWPGL